ncbi:MAG: hypothetical protein CFH30_00573 [Alphaproteobacteria bacterium MarineAlpha8_Bin1]|nr:MAG: hypothetical protein CFH30_00573 [Alphaproteobacteria bacterium MarineAlpha8_Bin1]|tara:strand:- start:848 stop:1540 length:693 start_codon:yes stop_codon:yes gene_type:complete
MEVEALSSLSSTCSKTFSESIESGSSSEEAFANSLELMSNTMADMGLSTSEINNVLSKCTEIFNEALSNDLLPLEALNSSLYMLDKFIEQETSSSREENEKNDQNIGDKEEYDFNFAHSSQSKATELMNDAIAKGMSTEEALKYVNNKIFPNQDENVQGPPTLAEINELKSQNIDFAKDEVGQENNELDKIEADMDAEAGNIVYKPTSDDENKLEQDANQIVDDKDDDIS